MEIKVTAVVSEENNDPRVEGSKAVKFASCLIYLTELSTQNSDDQETGGTEISCFDCVGPCECIS